MPAVRTALESRLAVAILLVAALLFAQWAGLAHRADHGPLASQHLDEPGDDDSHAGHSCVAFDAAAVADAMTLPSFVAPALTGATVLALWAAFASWDAPPVLHFASRAPPVS